MKKTAFLIILFMTSLSYAEVDRPPQFVLLAFDGSKSLNMWGETRAFAQSENIKFTYFVSGVYYISESQKGRYVEPKRGAGKSAIGFGASTQDVRERVSQTLRAYEEGHEIASHANGHYNGEDYSVEDWNSELTQFRDILTEAKTHLSSEEHSKWDQVLSSIKGFRAPLLGVSRQTFESLKSHGYTYDTSLVQYPEYWPQRVDGLWTFPLAGIKIEGSRVNTLSMDYNFYYQQSGAKPAEPSELEFFEEQVLNTYIKYFLKNYHGNRAPLHIGHHFSKWNNGVYWRAFKRFAQKVCSLEEVVCGTNSDLENFLQENSENTIAYQAGDFAKAEMSMEDSIILGLQNITLENKPYSEAPLSLLEQVKANGSCGGHDEDDHSNHTTDL